MLYGSHAVRPTVVYDRLSDAVPTQPLCNHGIRRCVCVFGLGGGSDLAIKELPRGRQETQYLDI